MHVRKAERVAKFWLDPEIAVAETYRMKSSELRKVLEVIEAKQDLIRRKWHEFFGD